ncbi:hypothetical protein DFH27DRAFT_559148 [Peziza echinospora]|nr:hypothetical protein DFH27DRAFT_559148 [Peziza echinospora]
MIQSIVLIFPPPSHVFVPTIVLITPPPSHIFVTSLVIMTSTTTSIISATVTETAKIGCMEMLSEQSLAGMSSDWKKGIWIFVGFLILLQVLKRAFFQYLELQLEKQRIDNDKMPSCHSHHVLHRVS